MTRAQHQAPVRVPRRLPLVGGGSHYQGFVVYRGPSAFDGKPIVAIVSGAGGVSDNPKTGPMAQLWILPADVAPNEAQRTGDDVSVCGDCPARPAVYRQTGAERCYVTTYQAALSTWKSRREQPVDLGGCCALLTRARASLRLGAFGDPAALPRHVIARLVRAAWAGGGCTTGYTHAWRVSRKRWLRRYTMASVESAADAALAQAAGWRTFRVRRRDTADEALGPREITCPASEESPTRRRDGSPVQCMTCRLCDGRVGEDALHTDDRRNIAIYAH